MKMIVLLAAFTLWACAVDSPSSEARLASGSPSLCTIQDQIDGRCVGPFSLLADYTRSYAAQFDPEAHGELDCYRTGNLTQCQVFIDVPGYTIIVRCDLHDGDTKATCIDSKMPT